MKLRQKEETDSISSKSQIATLNVSGNLRGSNIKKMPFAFTEQGIYMLMTVLKGDLATKQSIALIRTFKEMKDFILANNINENKEILQISIQTTQNTNDIARIKNEMVTKNDLASSKDAGNKITSISKINDKDIYHHIINDRIFHPIVPIHRGR